jgi:hypothetical protein
MLANPLGKRQAARTQLRGQISLPEFVLDVGQLGAVRVAGRDEGAAICPMQAVSELQHRIGLVDEQREFEPWHLVVGLAVGLGQARLERRVRQQKTLRFTGGPTLTRLVAPSGTTSAFANHLARVGRLAWASAHLRMYALF